MHRLAVLTSALLSALLLSSCAQPPTVQVLNTQPAREQARAAEPAAGSLYAGWRVFQQRCASCHGALADGAEGAPNLLVRLQGLGPQRFVDLVLRRYPAELSLPTTGSSREDLVDEVVARRAGALSMPAWQGDAVVQAHVMDLYHYLSARAEGRQDGSPPRR